MKIAVVGTGYVGLSIATLLAQHNEVVAVDVIAEKVEKINNRIPPIQDEYIKDFFASKTLNLRATLNSKEAYQYAELVIVAVPTNYDSHNNFFNTSLVELVIGEILAVNPSTSIIIKSTVPVGYTEALNLKFGVDNILFSPEYNFYL